MEVPDEGITKLQCDSISEQTLISNQHVNTSDCITAGR